LLGSSFQRGWAAEAADRQLIWVEGSVEWEAVHDISGSTVQQQQQEESEGRALQDPEKIQDGVQGATLGYASRLGTWADSQDQVPTLSRN
jgi:hypothetical protein